MKQYTDQKYWELRRNFIMKIHDMSFRSIIDNENIMEEACELFDSVCEAEVFK